MRSPPVTALSSDTVWFISEKMISKDIGAVIILSKNVPAGIITERDIVEKIVADWQNSRRILVGFGSPSRGLHEIVDEEGLKLEEVADLIVNTVPRQGTETVRTEEAVIASLAVLNSRLLSKA